MREIASGLSENWLLAQHPLAGNIFENMVVGEILKARLNAGKSPNMYFFRDSQGFEVDVVIEEGGALHPIEIKSSSTFSAAFAKGIEKFRMICPESSKGVVVYAGADLESSEKTSYVNFENIVLSS